MIFIDPSIFVNCKLKLVIMYSGVGVVNIATIIVPRIDEKVKKIFN